MKIKNSNSSIDKIFAHSKIFQTLKVPERSKRLNELHKNVFKLRQSLGLLDQPKNKRKIIRKKQMKNAIIINPTSKSIITNKGDEKKIRKYASLENLITQNDSNNESITISSPLKDRKILYMDRASALRRKNQVLLQKMKVKNKNQIKEDSYRNIYNINKNDIFVTEFNLPSINNNKINNNHNYLRKVHTESNNYYENTINNIEKNKNNNKNVKFKMNDIIIRSSSDRKILPPIKAQNNILVNYSNLSKNKSKKLYNNSNNNFNDSINSELSISNINKMINEENEKEDNYDDYNNINKDNINKSKNLTIESPRSKSYDRKNFSKLNNQIINIFGNNSQKSSNIPEIKNIITNVNKINTNFKNRRFYYDLQKWIMRSKFKYADWKYGIPDTEKYFIDMREYGEQEEKELEMRKSFYEKVDLVIKELKEDKEKRDILEIQNKYGIKINNEEPKIIKDNEYWIDEKATNKMEELGKLLKVTKERKKKENRKRNLIEEILFQCKKGANNINNS